MTTILVHNLPEATHRALQARAKQAEPSTEVEIRAILEAELQPEHAPRPGSLLVAIGQDIGGVERAITREAEPDEPVPFT
jgi:plasmid stability protein-like protein